MTMSWPHIGERVCDCWHEHSRIDRIRPGGIVELSNGTTHSYELCCDPADHPPHDDLPAMPDGWEPICAHWRQLNP